MKICWITNVEEKNRINKIYLKKIKFKKNI